VGIYQYKTCLPDGSGWDDGTYCQPDENCVDGQCQPAGGASGGSSGCGCGVATGSPALGSLLLLLLTRRRS
jgi:hypothetical protein